MIKIAVILLLYILSFGYANAETEEKMGYSKLDRQHIDNFIRRMKSWGEYYNDLAGCENLELAYDSEIKGGELLIEGGDWAVFDRRLCSGAYGVSHEDGSIFPIKLKKPKAHDNHCFKPEITSSVDAITLMRRYQWFHALFIDWAHVLTPTPLGVGQWDSFERIDADYAKESPELANDPHLALYWLMHFGFTLDERYQQVKALIERHQLAQRLPIINDALTFFDQTSAYENIAISNSYDGKDLFEDIFLKRRAYLIYSTSSYKYAGTLKDWWYSITIYPRAERYMIKRMRWLGNNLKKYNKWESFSELVKKTPDSNSISLLAYVQALNPLVNAEERQLYAAKFLKEMITQEQLWKNPDERRFGQVMIWDVRDYIADKALLETATGIYFAGDTISEHFQDINVILHGKNANADTAMVRELVSVMEDAEKGFDPFNATVKQREDFYRVIDDSLKKANETSTSLLFKVIENLNKNELEKRALHYLYSHNISDKNEAFTKLYIRLEPSDHDIPEIFSGIFPKMLKNPHDPNLALAKSLLFIPEEDYRNDSMAQNAQAAAIMFFLDSAHWPDNFEFFMQVLKDEKYNELKNLKGTIFTHLLSEEYDTKINPTNKMNQEQLEIMLETISDILRKPDWFKYDFTQEAIRSIYYLENPMARDWMEQHYNNKAWLKTFPNIDMGFDPLRVEINEAIESSLEFISQNGKASQ